MFVDTLRAYSKIMSEKIRNPYYLQDIQAQKVSLLFSALKTMQIKGDFDKCPACKFMMESKDIDSSKLNLCTRCSHLYEEAKYMKGNHACNCWKAIYLFSYRHVIKTYIPGACPYCLTMNMDYERGKDNEIKFILDDCSEMYCIMECRDCKRKSREYFNLKFKVSEGI